MWIITGKQTSILSNLARYKFLSRRQMALLGIEYYNSNYSKHCGSLVEAKLIGSFDASTYGVGMVYYLKLKGAKIIAEHLDLEIDNLNYVKTEPKLSSQSLYHRMYSINFQIILDLNCKEKGMSVGMYLRDIETRGSVRNGNNLERMTRIDLPNKRYLEPDGIFTVQHDTYELWYVLELENNTFKKKSYEKIERHIEALTNKLIAKKFEKDKYHRILMVYTDKGIMDNVMKEVKKEVEDADKWILFKCYEDIMPEINKKNSKFLVGSIPDVFSNWETVERKVVSMLWF